MRSAILLEALPKDRACGGGDKDRSSFARKILVGRMQVEIEVGPIPPETNGRLSKHRERCCAAEFEERK